MTGSLSPWRCGRCRRAREAPSAVPTEALLSRRSERAFQSFRSFEEFRCHAQAKYSSSEEACKAAKKFAVSGDAQQVLCSGLSL